MARTRSMTKSSREEQKKKDKQNKKNKKKKDEVNRRCCFNNRDTSPWEAAKKISKNEMIHIGARAGIKTFDSAYYFQLRKLILEYTIILLTGALKVATRRSINRRRALIINHHDIKYYLLNGLNVREYRDGFQKMYRDKPRFQMYRKKPKK
jgi:hypothetical protein